MKFLDIIIFATISASVFVTVCVPAFAGVDEIMRDQILVMEERWDQHSLIKEGDIFHYRICQKNFTCFDIRMEATSKSEKGHHFDVVAQDRLGYYVNDGMQNVKLGEVIGDIETDTSSINYMWGDNLQIKQKKDATEKECPRCIPNEEFKIIMDGKMSLRATPSYGSNPDVMTLEAGLSSLIEPSNITATNNTPNAAIDINGKTIMHYLPALKKGDTLAYMMCSDMCKEFELKYDKINRHGIHFDVSVYEKSLEQNSGEVTVKYWRYNEASGQQPIKYDDHLEHSEFEIIVDHTWRLGNSPEYNYNKYIKGIENTLFFIGGEARIGDGELLQFEPVLELGEMWSDSDNYEIVINDIESEYYYNYITIWEKLYIGKYTTSKPAIEFVISPRVPIPLSSTYIGENTYGDPLNENVSWFRMIDHVTIHEPEDVVVIDYDDVVYDIIDDIIDETIDEPVDIIDRKTAESTDPIILDDVIITKMKRVIDGDTVVTVEDVTVRFSLASAPELGEMGGDESRDLISDICPPGSEIFVDEDDGQPDGSYGRIVAKVHCNGVNLNEYLLENILEAKIMLQFCAGSEFEFEPWAIRNGC